MTSTGAGAASPDYLDVTELAGDEVSQEQIQRAARRYAWALPFCDGKDVLEVACGTGPGLGLLLKRARRVLAGDISDAMVKQVQRHYGNRVTVKRMDAQQLPFGANSLDVIIIFEALYYVRDAGSFAKECQRVLRSGGAVLISNANKDLFDFNPSPYSHVYHGVRELTELFGPLGFRVSFCGDSPVAHLSLRQRILRPIKKIVVGVGLMPKTMAGKKLLKRLVFGNMVPFPAEITEAMLPPLQLVRLQAGTPDLSHKVILCAATKP